MALQSPASIQGPENPHAERKGNWKRSLDPGEMGQGQLRAAQVLCSKWRGQAWSPAPPVTGEASHVRCVTVRRLVILETVSLVTVGYHYPGHRL